MLIIDAHQDLAWNMLTFGRDYTLSASVIRERERNGLAPLHNGDTLLGWPEYQRGRVAIVFSTLFATPARRKAGDWDILCYGDTGQAKTLYREQLDLYHRLAEDHPEKFRLVLTRKELQAVWDHWETEMVDEHPVGLVVLMEGAEALGELQELEEWWESGVRIIGPAWAGTRFCGGTREPGPLTKEGYALLEAMAEFSYVLDISHMDESSALQSLDTYPGAVIASHANAQALLKGLDTNRHLPDRVIQLLLERGGVIGVVPVNPFLLPGWHRGDPRQRVTLERVVAQVDYICQMAGDASHVGLGSDFDGGFGVQSVPLEVDTIADLQKLAPLLAEKGYTDTDIAAILGENWKALLQRALPESL